MPFFIIDDDGNLLDAVETREAAIEALIEASGETDDPSGVALIEVDESGRAVAPASFAYEYRPMAVDVHSMHAAFLSVATSASGQDIIDWDPRVGEISSRRLSFAA